MHNESIEPWEHHHTFGTDAKTRGEMRTWWVIGLTTVMIRSVASLMALRR